MNLPFFKASRWPRIAPHRDSKSYGLDADEAMEERCIQELMDAVQDKNVSAFRGAVEALVLSLFEDQEMPDAR